MDDDNGFDEDDLFEPEPLDEHETAHVEQDLADLMEFEATFRPEGYRGVAVWCHDCAEEHFYPWDMLRENLTALLETGETPVHEPAFGPNPDQYIAWDYARGYVDALRDTGAKERIGLMACDRCGLPLEDTLAHSNFCPRCGTPLLTQRLRDALLQTGLDEASTVAVLRATGLSSRSS